MAPAGRRGGLGWLVGCVAVAAAGCGAPEAPVAQRAGPAGAAPSTTVATVITADPVLQVPDVTTTVAPVPAPPKPAPPTTTAPTTATAQPRVRSVVSTGFSPFATVGGVTLSHPAAVVERVGFHESNHDGARQLEVLATAAAPITVETRDRGTGSRTAADIVVPPGTQIRSPVTGKVKRAGGYVLYCKHSDDFVVIEPDAHPGWEVKILHIDGERVSAGQRVTAGQTVIAPRPTLLPFASQVDDHRTADPAWPHVHVEVVDPAIKDRPSPGGGCA